MLHSSHQFNGNLNKTPTSKAGWSLVEILVVIALMAIVTGVVAPQVQQALVRGKGRACTASLKAIEAAKDAWRRDFGETPIPNNAALTRYTGGKFPEDPWGLGFSNVLNLSTQVSSPANNDPSKEPAGNCGPLNGFNDLGSE
jgi:prepilin-type N-terminal cleavage/methylation domain-containing protein